MQGSLSQKVKAGPVFYGSLSLLFFGFLVIGSLGQITTTQAVLLKLDNAAVFKTNLEVVLQLPRLLGLMQPALSISEGSAVLISWFMTIGFMAFVAGNEIFDHVHRGRGAFIVWLFRGGMAIIVFYNGVCDYQFGLQVFGDWFFGFLFAMMIGFMVAFCGPLCAQFAQRAYDAA